MRNNDDTSQTVAVSLLQFLRKFCNCVLVISFQSCITLSDSGWTCQQISGHVHFRPDFENLDPVHPETYVFAMSTDIRESFYQWIPTD